MGEDDLLRDPAEAHPLQTPSASRLALPDPLERARYVQRHRSSMGEGINGVCSSASSSPLEEREVVMPGDPVRLRVGLWQTPDTYSKM